MATPKKKHLIELMIEAGVEWPEGAEYAAQDKLNLWLYFFKMKPSIRPGDEHYSAKLGPIGNPHLLPSLCRNWHQTIVTLEQYAEALNATAMTQAAQQETQPSPEYCASVMRQMPDNTIEQLTADYHAKAAEADRLQYAADEALKAADDALRALEKACELLGLVISIDTKPKQVGQLDITDWRDLLVGDVVEYVHGTVSSREGKQGSVCEIDEFDNHNRIRVMFGKDERFWCSNWRFIRRP